MEELKSGGWIARESKNDRYDKRLINEVLEQVYLGIPRKELVLRYGLGKSTIGKWLRKYGSAAYSQNKKKSYPVKDKRSVVAAVSQGRMTVREAQISYGIRSDDTVRQWMASEAEKSDLCLSIPGIMAKKTENPSEDIEALRKELELAQLKIKALNVMIDIAEDQLKINIRKKSGARPSRK